MGCFYFLAIASNAANEHYCTFFCKPVFASLGYVHMSRIAGHVTTLLTL